MLTALPQWHRLIRTFLWLQKIRAKEDSTSQMLISLVSFLTQTIRDLCAAPGLVYDRNWSSGVIHGSDVWLTTDASEEFLLGILCLDNYLIARVEKAKPLPPSFTEISCSGVSYIFCNRYWKYFGSIHLSSQCVFNLAWGGRDLFLTSVVNNESFSSTDSLLGFNL